MQGRKLVITGGFGVLGQAVARAAVEAGAKVVLVDMGIKAPQGSPRAAAELFGVDLSLPFQAEPALAKANEALGGIDALLNVAGGFVWQTLEGGDLANWERLFKVNLLTAVTATRAALPFLTASGSGAVVNVGANGAVKAAAGMGAYAASKAGVHRLTESLAEELKGKVRVNAVLPSIIDTPQNRADMPDADFQAWVKPEELARAMLFLASPAASAVTGALVPVTGRV